MNDVDSNYRKALEQLRSEVIPADACSAMLRQLDAPRRRRPTRWLAAGATCGLLVAAVLLWPQQRALAWSQVLAATRANTKFHTVRYQLAEDGKTWQSGGEEWVDGDKWSFEYRSKPFGQFPARRHIIRCDGKRMFRSPLGFSGPENLGVVNEIKSPRRPFGEKFSIQNFLASRWIDNASKPESTKLDGKAVLRYAVTPKRATLEKEVVYADPATGIMVREERQDAAGRTTSYVTIQTPKEIPASQFEPPAGMTVIDDDAEHAKLAAIMAKGIPYGKGNVLRALIGDGGPYLTMWWTGQNPNSDGRPCPHVEGNKVVRVASGWYFGLQPDGQAAGSQHYKGAPMYNLELTLAKPAGKFVDLDMPVLVPDHSRPIIDRKGKLAGYWPKQVGTTRLDHVEVHDVRGGFGSF